MIVKVLFFASAVEATGGVSDLNVEFDDTNTAEKITTTQLIAKLETMFPKLNVELNQISIAVNEVYCTEEAILSNADTVALLPPISGG